MIFPKDVVLQDSGCIYVATRKDSHRPDYRPYCVYEGGLWSGHRLSYHLNNGPIPRLCGDKNNGFVLHTCDDKRCINPAHLYLGDRSQNTKDVFERMPGFKEGLAASCRNWNAANPIKAVERGRRSGEVRRAG